MKDGDSSNSKAHWCHIPNLYYEMMYYHFIFDHALIFLYAVEYFVGFELYFD